jgi:hypothetical protein
MIRLLQTRGFKPIEIDRDVGGCGVGQKSCPANVTLLEY